MKAIQAIRGMNDILPDESRIWQYIENALIDAAEQYGYREIRLPIVEYLQLFSRSIGDVTDIVEKEMYQFQDRHEEWLALRPEGTAGCVRAAIQRNLLYEQTQRLWYLGPMFRYERPQQGRYRQFHQFGIEAFGFAEPLADVELLAMTHRVWQALGIRDNVCLELNSLGSPKAREHYRSVLVDYFKQHVEQLDQDSQRRLHTNPLRILDSKNPDMQTLIENAPKLNQYLDDADKQHFAVICNSLEKLSIPYKINTRLVRGLDYYNRTVFEWTTTALGAQGTLCAGGRYDNLVAMLGGKPIPATGFAVGLERLVELIKQTKHAHKTTRLPAIYFISEGEAQRQQALVLAENLRQAFPKLNITQHFGEGGFKSQFKKADQSGAEFAMIIGENELAKRVVAIKFLRQDREQMEIPFNQLCQFIQNELARSDYAHV